MQSYLPYNSKRPNRERLCEKRKEKKHIFTICAFNEFNNHAALYFVTL